MFVLGTLLCVVFPRGPSWQSGHPVNAAEGRGRHLEGLIPAMKCFSLTSLLLTSHWSAWPPNHRGRGTSFLLISRQGEWGIGRSTNDNHGHLSVLSAVLASVPCRISSVWICTWFFQHASGLECLCPALRRLLGDLTEGKCSRLFSLSCMILLNPYTVPWDGDCCFILLMMSWYWGKLDHFIKSGLTNK